MPQKIDMRALQFDAPASNQSLPISRRQQLPNIWLRSHTGRVMEVRERSDMQVSGYGTADFIRVRSHHTIVQEVWIKDRDNLEESIQVSDWQIRVRQGQVMTIVWGQLPGKTAKPLFCYNHTTEEMFYSIRTVRDYFIPHINTVKHQAFPVLLIGALICGAIVWKASPQLHGIGLAIGFVPLLSYWVALRPSTAEINHTIAQIRFALHQINPSR